ncbi:MAG: CinA family protein [Granulosicoccus sp.]
MQESENTSRQLSTTLGQLLVARKWTVSTAESCTGGLLAGSITDVPGSSGWFEQGVVTYSNTAKMSLLGVNADILKLEGAVSEAVVRAMVTGTLGNSDADIAVAVSGIAGPGGARPGKPIGTVWIAWGRRTGERTSRCFLFDGGRCKVRQAAVREGLRGTIALINMSGNDE